MQRSTQTGKKSYYSIFLIVLGGCLFGIFIGSLFTIGIEIFRFNSTGYNIHNLPNYGDIVAIDWVILVIGLLSMAIGVHRLQREK
jgi:hypothetical protein